MLIKIKNFNLLNINFKKPWWNLAFQQKSLFYVVVITVAINQILLTMIPFGAAKLFESKSYFFCIVVFISWFILDLLFNFFRAKFNAQFQLQCIHSIYQNAYSYLLTIDPKFHVYRSSGAVIAKIDRAARGYEDFLDYITFELTPLIIGLITVISILAYYSITLALIMTCFILIIIYIGYYFATKTIKKWEKESIEKDDIFKSSALENLTQIQLIRSTYASNFRNNLLNKNIMNNMITDSYRWLSYSQLFLLLSLLYILSLFVLSMILLWQINTNIMASSMAVGLFLSYIQSSKEIVRFSMLLKRIIRSKTAIEDLFNFINNFGQQSFPVLGDSSIIINKQENIEIVANNISFDYGKAILFNDHTFSFKTLSNQELKLYGIIGKSGSGKTTLLSILGGQLKPIKGNILINDIDIYKINDAQRSQLLALQGQISSNLFGTVKNNLLLGLPENHNYNDQDLENILEQVGLLDTLNEYQGLMTILGEGGLNISGGQRQRLNFASLYLRAIYYKPLLVLIDEPTSSLDEISELAITNMIERLAKTSVTLVVAHRLKTIEKAVGIIDLSLLQNEKTIKVYSSDELQNHSSYYRDLIIGKKTLDVGLTTDTNLCK